MIGRREVLAAGAAGVALFAAPRAEACSIAAQRLVRFSDRESRRALQQWVDLLNRAPEMTLEAIEERSDVRNMSIDYGMIAQVMGDAARARSGDGLFYKRFRLSGGRLDSRPIRIEEVNLIRQLRNQATYQFTLERYSYHPADPEGCNGLFSHDEYWGVERVSYIATVLNNRLRSVRPFPEWYLEERRS